MPSGHVDKSKPLRPLTAHAWEVLDGLERGPCLYASINAGVTDRFFREGLAEERWFDAYGNGKKRYLVISEAGRQKLAARGA